MVALTDLKVSPKVWSSRKWSLALRTAISTVFAITSNVVDGIHIEFGANHNVETLVSISLDHQRWSGGKKCQTDASSLTACNLWRFFLFTDRNVHYHFQDFLRRVCHGYLVEWLDQRLNCNLFTKKNPIVQIRQCDLLSPMQLVALCNSFTWMSHRLEKVFENISRYSKTPPQLCPSISSQHPRIPGLTFLDISVIIDADINSWWEKLIIIICYHGKRYGDPSLSRIYLWALVVHRGVRTHNLCMENIFGTVTATREQYCSTSFF